MYPSKELLMILDTYCKLDEIATHMNECVRQHENFLTMLSIQNRFTGNQRPMLVVPGEYERQVPMYSCDDINLPYIIQSLFGENLESKSFV